MTPLQFEQRWSAEWDELSALLDAVEGRKRGAKSNPVKPFPAERLAALYRRVCEHLAAARARAYPVTLIARLDDLSHRAHQVIYRRREWGWAALAHIFTHDFPQAVRAHRGYVLVATLLFVLPMLVLGGLTYVRPSFALTVLDVSQLAKYEAMYSTTQDARSADNDWGMFGHYIRNNISVGFQCFAGGLVAGLGAVLALVFNGLLAGVVGGYLSARGLAESFWSFVVTHAAFELTAIVLAGAAGLRLGQAWLMPGRRTRLQALMRAARAVVPILYGVMAMLFIAAVLEAFWSSARWLPVTVKYAVAALCWTGVFAYFIRQGHKSVVARVSA